MGGGEEGARAGGREGGRRWRASSWRPGGEGLWEEEEGGGEGAPLGDGALEGGGLWGCCKLLLMLLLAPHVFFRVETHHQLPVMYVIIECWFYAH